MKESIFRNLSKDTLLNEVDACIGIVVILRFLNEALDVTTFDIEDAKFDADVIRNSSLQQKRITERFYRDVSM